MALSFQYYSIAVLSVLVIISLFSQPALSQNDKQTQDLINRICRQTEDYGYCNKIFHQNLPSPTTDIFGLTKITIDQALNNATNTHTFIIELLQNTTLDPALKNSLIVCENGYRIVMKSFQDASREFDEKDYKAVVDSERGTPRAQGSCITCFIVPPNPRNPLVERNRQMRIIISMAVVSGSMLNP